MRGRFKKLCWGVGALAAAGALFLALSWALIDWDDAGCDRYPGGAVLRDAAGGVLRVTLGPGDIDCRPTYVASRDTWIAKALVAAEDGTFWEHCGVRPLSVLRAAWQNVATGRRISGASTISMQAVRLMRPHRKSLWEKWKEAVRALKMERAKSKEWILSQYLNRAPFGSNLVGIEAAAQGWFGKEAKALGLGESALLAGMVQAPTRFRPDTGYERAMARRDWVLGRMQELGLATAEQVAGARTVRPKVVPRPRPYRAPHYCDWVLKGRRAAGIADGGEVATPLLPDVQASCERAVAAASAGGRPSAAVVRRVATGEVVALAVSGVYTDPNGGQFNTAAAARPAGSSLKPLLTALALDAGIVTPEERLADVPTAYRGYRPANFDTAYRGRVTLRDALVLSLNVPFVQLLKRVGVTRFGDTLRSLGFAHLGGLDETFGLGMAIGSVEVSLVELTGAYAKLAGGGEGGAAFSPGARYLVADMLSGQERSQAALGHVADVPLPRFAWKTGTSSAYRDAWTVLWNPEWVVGVWCGHLSGGFGDQTVVGAKAAAPVAWGIARALYPSGRGPWFAEPPGAIERRRVCRLTGLPAGPDCPLTETGRALAGRSAATPCGVHRRGADGRLVVLEDAALAAFAGRAAKAAALTVAQPEEGAAFRRVPGRLDQRVVCRASGCPASARLWWFVDGRPAGDKAGNEAFAASLADLAAGEHVLSCATAEGVSASVRITVADP